MAEKKIGGAEYRVAPLNAKDAYYLLAEIIRLAGPGARHLPGIVRIAAHEDEKDRFLSEVASFGACSEILNAHGAEAFVEFKSRVISIAQIKRQSGVVEHVDLSVDFEGDLETAEEVYDFVMETQFGNFSEGSKVRGPAAFAMILVRNTFRLQKSSR